MDNKSDTGRLTRFVNDEATSACVYDFLLRSFLSKTGDRDVQVLAAERLAIQFLDKAWSDLSRFRADASEPSGSSKVKYL